MKEQKRKAQVKKNYEIIPTPCLPPATQYESTTPHPPAYPIPTSFIITIQWTHNSWYK